MCIPEEDAYYVYISFGALSDVTVIRGMRQSIPILYHILRMTVRVVTAYSREDDMSSRM